MKKHLSPVAVLAVDLALATGLSSCTINVNNDSVTNNIAPSAALDAATVQPAVSVSVSVSKDAEAPRLDASKPEGEAELDSGSSAPDGVGIDASGVVQTDPNVFRPTVVPMTPERVASLKAPPGLSVRVYATGLGNARMLAVHGEHVYVTRPQQGDVLILSNSTTDKGADTPIAALEGLEGVHGIAFHEDTVYLATVTDVWSAAVNEDGTFGDANPVHTNLPDGGQHPYRTLGFGPDGALYISIGSDCDACRETNKEHATILRAPMDGQRSVFASGLRNTIGFGWHPTSGAFWGMDNGSDLRGNLLPPEELNQIIAGRDYGWPYCYAQNQLDPIMGDPPEGTQEAYCAATEPATLVDDAHGAPIGMLFYTGDMFPAEYKNDAFVAMRGSWNRFPPSGYQVNRVHFDADGQPVRSEPFVSGFLLNNGTEAFARIAGLTIHPDGSLLISDDANGVIYRVISE